MMEIIADLMIIAGISALIYVVLDILGVGNGYDGEDDDDAW